MALKILALKNNIDEADIALSLFCPLNINDYILFTNKTKFLHYPR